MYFDSTSQSGGLTPEAQKPNVKDAWKAFRKQRELQRRAQVVPIQNSISVEEISPPSDLSVDPLTTNTRTNLSTVLLKENGPSGDDQQELSLSTDIPQVQENTEEEPVPSKSHSPGLEREVREVTFPLVPAKSPHDFSLVVETELQPNEFGVLTSIPKVPTESTKLYDEDLIRDVPLPLPPAPSTEETPQGFPLASTPTDPETAPTNPPEKTPAELPKPIEKQKDLSSPSGISVEKIRNVIELFFIRHENLRLQLQDVISMTEDISDPIEMFDQRVLLIDGLEKEVVKLEGVLPSEKLMPLINLFLEERAKAPFSIKKPEHSIQIIVHFDSLKHLLPEIEWQEIQENFLWLDSLKKQYPLSEKISSHDVYEALAIAEIYNPEHLIRKPILFLRIMTLLCRRLREKMCNDVKEYAPKKEDKVVRFNQQKIHDQLLFFRRLDEILTFSVDSNHPARISYSLLVDRLSYFFQRLEDAKAEKINLEKQLAERLHGKFVHGPTSEVLRRMLLEHEKIIAYLQEKLSVAKKHMDDLLLDTFKL